MTALLNNCYVACFPVTFLSAKGMWLDRAFRNLAGVKALKMQCLQLASLSVPVLLKSTCSTFLKSLCLTCDVGVSTENPNGLTSPFSCPVLPWALLKTLFEFKDAFFFCIHLRTMCTWRWLYIIKVRSKQCLETNSSWTGTKYLGLS